MQYYPRLQLNCQCQQLDLFRKQLSRKISFAKIRKNGYDQFSAVFLPPSQLKRCPGCRTATNAAHQTFQFGQSPAGIKSVFIADLNHVVDYFQIQHVGNKTCADALNCMFAGLKLLAGEFLGR